MVARLHLPPNHAKSVQPHLLRKALEKTMSEREQLAQLISRTMPTAPSVMADAILASEWLKDHDATISGGRDE